MLEQPVTPLLELLVEGHLELGRLAGAGEAERLEHAPDHARARADEWLHLVRVRVRVRLRLRARLRVSSPRAGPRP